MMREESYELLLITCGVFITNTCVAHNSIVSKSSMLRSELSKHMLHKKLIITLDHVTNKTSLLNPS